MKIHGVHRVIPAIGEGGEPVVFVCQGIHAEKPTYGGVVHPHLEVVEVERDAGQRLVLQLLASEQAAVGASGVVSAPKGEAAVEGVRHVVVTEPGGVAPPSPGVMAQPLHGVAANGGRQVALVVLEGVVHLVQFDVISLIRWSFLPNNNPNTLLWE